MSKEISVSIIGLDTSHSVEFPRRYQAPDFPEESRVEGIRVKKCLRFPSAFFNEEGQDERQKQLEQWGIEVTRDFDEAVEGAEALLVCINDPALHREYFEKSAEVGVPIFLDKPMADTFENGLAMARTAKDKGVRFFSASSLRFHPALRQACDAVPDPLRVSIYGPIGKAPKGSSVVWYGVHAFDMLQNAMGPGSKKIHTHATPNGPVAVVDYEDGRLGVVEMSETSYAFGGNLRLEKESTGFTCDAGDTYSFELKSIVNFFQGEPAPVQVEDTLEVTAMLQAAEKSLQSGQPCAVEQARS